MAQILPLFCRAGRGRSARVCCERALAGSKEVKSHDAGHAGRSSALLRKPSAAQPFVRAGAVILTFARHAYPQQTGMDI